MLEIQSLDYFYYFFTSTLGFGNVTTICFSNSPQGKSRHKGIQEEQHIIYLGGMETIVNLVNCLQVNRLI